MKKYLAIIGVGLAVAVGVGAVVYWALTPTPGVTMENFKRLHRGMERAEVEAILGERGRDLGKVPHGGRDQRRYEAMTLWQSGGNSIVAISFFKFDKRGGNQIPNDREGLELAVWGSYCNYGFDLDLAPEPKPLIERIRAWLGI